MSDMNTELRLQYFPEERGKGGTKENYTTNIELNDFRKKMEFINSLPMVFLVVLFSDIVPYLLSRSYGFGINVQSVKYILWTWKTNLV